METKRTPQKINETKIWVFEKINIISKPLFKLTERNRRHKVTKLELRRSYHNKYQ
jgi:hypothetical protein